MGDGLVAHLAPCSIIDLAQTVLDHVHHEKEMAYRALP